jgi:hypothetical protein
VSLAVPDQRSLPSAGLNAPQQRWFLRFWRTATDNRLRVRAAVVVVVVGLAPLAFVDGSSGTGHFAAIAWVTIGLLCTVVLLCLPVKRRRLGLATFYLAFLVVAGASLGWAFETGKAISSLAQFTVPFLVLVLARETPRKLVLTPLLSWVALADLVAAWLVHLAGLGVGAGRATSIGIVALALVATSVPRSRTFVFVVVALSLGFNIATGARTASVVMLIVTIALPAWRIRWMPRLIFAAVALLGLILFSHTESFQNRFFFGGHGSLTELVTGSAQVNTAGRRELWPRLELECGRTPVLGNGIGASYRLASTFSEGVLDQPHNEYLRTFCDEGIAGGTPLGLFLVGSLFCAGVAWVRFPEQPIHGNAFLVVSALLLLGATDNPLVYTAQFMAPLALLVGLSCRGRPVDDDVGERSLPAAGLAQPRFVKASG